MGILDRIKRHLPIVGTPAPKPNIPLYVRPAPRAPEPEEAASPRGDRPVPEYVAELIKAHKVVLFMKGTPDAPSCGFSASASSILRGYGQPFHTFDVLVDGDVREGVKQFSNWPTIPQVFINGEFVGGSDILKQLHESGDLKTMLS
ncbi:hypothetical protein LBMAG42_40820 [Deltaproteobacteria bacterium]|nr:hypothetical protein LBMAG42_40820 [Deltaproteobacteria bacterium]